MCVCVCVTELYRHFRSAYSVSDPFNWRNEFEKGPIFSKYFQPRLEPFSEERTFEMTNKITSSLHLFKKLEEEQV